MADLTKARLFAGRAVYRLIWWPAVLAAVPFVFVADVIEWTSDRAFPRIAKIVQPVFSTIHSAAMSAGEAVAGRAALDAAHTQRERGSRMSEWQPIETAPKDGTFILAWGPQPVRDPGYEARQTYWAFYGEGSPARELFDQGKGPSGAWSWHEPCNHWAMSWRPTHWMPLPAPPLTALEAGE